MIYLDNAATEKPNENCIKAAKKYLYDDYYNPSALYKSGYGLHLELKSARSEILSHIADDNEFSLIFTSGGTEADNQALFCGGRRGNVVTTNGEHSAVFSAVNELKQRGIEVRFANLNADGSVDVEHLLSLIDDKTSLVSVIHVNNETGAVNDIFAIAEKIKAKNKYAMVHADGVQAYGKLKYKLTKDIDLYSISAHKIGGVKGCGALIKKKNLQIKPYIYGGGQEQGFRSGTENVFAIKCFEFAARDRYADLINSFEKARQLNKILRGALREDLFKVISSENASPYILSVAAKGVRGETILHEADDRGIIIGTGSACSSNQKKRFSRVILACGIDNQTADGVLRLSLSPTNTAEEVLKAAQELNEIVGNRKNIMA